MGAALIRIVIWDQYPPTHPLPSPRVFLPYFCQSVIFFVQKYLVQYQLLLWRSLQILHYLANKETKVLFNNKVKNPTPLPSCVQRHVRLHLGMNGRNLPPTLVLVDKTRLAMKLASLFVIYLCSLFCLLVGLHRAQNTRNTGTAEQLWNWGGGGDTISASILVGGTRHFFLLILYNFKSIGEGARAPPAPYSAVPGNIEMQQLMNN